MIQVKRVYEHPSRQDGKRILVDRLWPRGLKREETQIDEWMKDLGPSTELRKWFGHDPSKWSGFKKKFFQELNGRQEAIERLARLAGRSKITLLYGSKEERFNNAVALQEYLADRLKQQEEKKAA